MKKLLFLVALIIGFSIIRSPAPSSGGGSASSGSGGSGQSAVQVAGQISTNGTASGTAANFGNPGNSFTGAFIGNGSGLTNFYSTNGVNFRPVINLRDYGAGQGSVASDLAAWNSARALQKATGWKLVVPAGEYYGSNMIYDSTWQNLTNASTGGSVAYGAALIEGDRDYTVIHPASVNCPIFVFTNHLDGIYLKGLNFIGAGINVSAAPLVYIHGTNGTADGNTFEDCSFQNSWMGFRGDTMTSTLWKNCGFGGNNIAGFLEITGTEANNNNRFEGGSVVQNNNGFIVNHGSYVVNNLEMGGTHQTNVFLCTNASLVTFEFNGGNAEIDYGAMVKTTNSGYVNVKISASTRIVDATGLHGARAIDLAGDAFRTGGSDTVEIDGGRLVSIPVRVETNAWGVATWGPVYPTIVNNGGNNSAQVEYVSGTASGVGFTNYIGRFPLQVSLGNGGDLRNNAIRLDPLGYSFGGAGADMHYIFVRTNLAQLIAGVGLEQYFYDVVNGVAPQTTLINTWAKPQYINAGNSSSSVVDGLIIYNNGAENAGSGVAIGLYAGGNPITNPGGSSRAGEVKAVYVNGVWGTRLYLSPNADNAASNPTNLVYLDGVDKTTHVQGSGGLYVDNGGIAESTNYVASNFIPVAGMVKLVQSNGVWFSVTQYKTNFAFNGN